MHVASVYMCVRVEMHKTTSNYAFYGYVLQLNTLLLIYTYVYYVPIRLYLIALTGRPFLMQEIDPIHLN